MKKLFSLLLTTFMLNIALMAQHNHQHEGEDWVVLLGVYENALPNDYFDTEVLGTIKKEWNGYFYSYYSPKMPSEQAAMELMRKARSLGHVSAAVTQIDYAMHPCVFCATLRDSACWSGGGICSMPNYNRHHHFLIGGESHRGGFGMEPGVEVRNTHHPLPNDVEGTRFYVSPNFKEQLVAYNKKYERRSTPTYSEVPNTAVAYNDSRSVGSFRGTVKVSEVPTVPKDAMRPKSIDYPATERSLQPVERKNTNAPKTTTKGKGTQYFAQILATTAENMPNIGESSYAVYKEKQNGINKYVVGPFADYQSCVEYCKTAQNNGFTGAFPVKYIDGVRVK